jgi:hypothetical protein
MSTQIEASADSLAAVVADNVRAFAGRRMVSRSELARLLGMDLTSAGKRWRGEREWRLSELPAVADALGVTVFALMTPPGADGWAQRGSNPQPADSRSLDAFAADWTVAA